MIVWWFLWVWYSSIWPTLSVFISRLRSIKRKKINEWLLAQATFSLVFQGRIIRLTRIHNTLYTKSSNLHNLKERQSLMLFGLRIYELDWIIRGWVEPISTHDLSSYEMGEGMGSHYHLFPFTLYLVSTRCPSWVLSLTMENVQKKAFCFWYYMFI